jgi:hypothetical protein
MKKKTGIWLDFREANLITLHGKSELFETILSEIDTSRPKGGSRSKMPWGPMEKISERAFLERRKHEEKSYYDRIIDAVKDADEVYIFGPAQAKDGLVKAIKEKSNVFLPLLGDVETSDSMTKNQKIAQVKDFFSQHPV